MRRIIFEELKKVSGFEVDVRRVHEKSANILMFRLSKDERQSLGKGEFQVHIAVLEGSVEMRVEGRSEVFKSGCLASVLPDLEIELLALEDSRILVIKDDPLWVLRERRSVRKFSKVDVPRELVEKIVKHSTLAPSAGNVQPWRVYAVKDESVKRELAKASYDQEHVEKASWVLVVTASPKESAEEYGERGEKLYSIQDTASFVTYLTLVAKAFNLDTCWVGAFKDEEVWRIIGSPEGEVPVAIVPLGYGEESPEVPPRKGLDKILRFL